MAKKIDDRLIGRTLKRIRTAQKISRKAIATRTGFSTAEFTAFEKGEKPIPASTLWHCSRILNAPVSDFYDEDSANRLLHTIFRIRDDEIRSDLISFAQTIEIYC